MVKFIPFTARGLQKVQQEKEALLVKRKPAVESLRIAREMGDLSENGAYKAARAELSGIDSRLRHLTNLLLFGRVQSQPNPSVIGIGSKARLFDGKKTVEFEIVGSFESDPTRGRISHVSPLGKNLMGKGKGDQITVQTPNGILSYRILSVTSGQ